MKKMLIISMVLVLPVVLLNAQPEPEGIEEEEVIERPSLGPGMQGHSGPGGSEMKHKMIQKKMVKHQMGPWQMRENFDMPENVEENVINVIKKYDTAFASQLLKLKEENPKKYEIAIGISFKFLNMAKKAEDPTLEKDVVRGIALEYEVRELSAQYEKATDAEKNKLKEKIKANLNELFDIRTKGQEVRIKMMEKELSKLKTNIEKRKANKVRIVEQRLDQLTGGKDLSW